MSMQYKICNLLNLSKGPSILSFAPFPWLLGQRVFYPEGLTPSCNTVLCPVTSLPHPGVAR